MSKEGHSLIHLHILKEISSFGKCKCDFGYNKSHGREILGRILAMGEIGVLLTAPFYSFSIHIYFSKYLYYILFSLKIDFCHSCSWDINNSPVYFLNHCAENDGIEWLNYRSM